MFDYRVLAERCGVPYEIYHGEYRGVFTGQAEQCGDGLETAEYHVDGGYSGGGKMIPSGTIEREFKRMKDEDDRETWERIKKAAEARKAVAA